MDRRNVAGLVLAAVVVSSVGGWVAASRIQSPAEVAARTAPPAASPILVPAEERILSTDIVTRGTARFGSPQIISIAPSALKVDTGVVTQLPAPGTALAEGDLALSASGRPVFVLAGPVPTYRDLGPGLEGDDVRQLEDGLARLGFDPGPSDGLFDDLTESAVADWYTASGYAPFEATTDQLAAIRALEAELASERLDILSGQDAVAAAQADLASARAAHETALAIASGGPGAIAAAEAEARVNNLTADADVATAQAALTALQATGPASPADIAAAESAVTLAQAAAEATRLAGAGAIADAQAVLDSAPAALAAARAAATAADLAAAADVTAASDALVAVQADPAATPAEIAAAESALTLAEAAAEATRLAGVGAISDARAVLHRAPAALVAAQADAAAADLVAAADLTVAQRELDALLNPVAGTRAEIDAAQRDLTEAVAHADAVRLAGEELIAAAKAGKLSAGADVGAAAAAVSAAETALANARAASNVRAVPTTGGQLELDLAKRRAGIQVPADELIFAANLPLRVSEVTAVPGDSASGPMMTVTDAVVTVDSSLPLEEAPLVEVGLTVLIDEPDLGIQATGIVSRIADTPGTDGVDGFHIYIEVTVDEAPAQIVGSSVRLSIPIESSGGSVLAVPIAALSLAADGTSRVQHDVNGTLQYSTVEPGLSADGFVGVTPTDGTLQPGDLVVVGFDQQGTAGG